MAPLGVSLFLIFGKSEHLGTTERAGAEPEFMLSLRMPSPPARRADAIGLYLDAAV
jgi:hypothetical protein